jgi:hypothetical protein
LDSVNYDKNPGLIRRLKSGWKIDAIADKKSLKLLVRYWRTGEAIPSKIAVHKYVYLDFDKRQQEKSGRSKYLHVFLIGRCT